MGGSASQRTTNSTSSADDAFKSATCPNRVPTSNEALPMNSTVSQRTTDRAATARRKKNEVIKSLFLLQQQQQSTMARLLLAAVSTIGRMGYSSAVAAAAARSRSSAGEEVVAKEGARRVEEASWVPDPATGYYRPADRTGEADPAELRRMLLARKA